MRLLVLMLMVMLNSPLVLGAVDSKASKARVSKEEKEIVEVLDILEEYELLQYMETVESLPEQSQRGKAIEEENKPDSEKNTKSEKK